MSRASEPERIHIRDRKQVAGLAELGLGCEVFERFHENSKTLHTHDLLEIAVVTGGDGRHLLTDGPHPAKPGSVVIVQQHQTHGYATGLTGLNLINIYMDLNRYRFPVLPNEIQAVIPRILCVHPGLDHLMRSCVYLELNAPEFIVPLLQQLHIELTEQPPGYATSADHIMALFLTACCRSLPRDHAGIMLQPTPASELSQDTRQRLERVRCFVDTHSGDHMPLNELAARAHYQPNYFCRVFKQHTGQTPIQYIQHRRLEQAMLKLRSSDHSITEIALNSGFCDVPHFNRLFKRETGGTPRAYRKTWTQSHRKPHS